jgi:transposase
MPRTSSPRSLEELEALVAQQQETLDRQREMIEERDALIAILQEWKRLAQSQRFGRKSERFASDEQARLFDEAEAILAKEVDTEGEDVAVPAPTRRKRRPRALPDFLPVQEIVHDLPDEEKICPHDPGHRLVEIGRETSDQLKFIPATVEIVRHVRPKYARGHCKQGVRIAPMPKLPVPKSIATPSLLAQVVTSKYVDGLPLYRQEKIFDRLGLGLSRATLAHWMVKMGDLVEPLVEEIRSEVRAGGFVQCDETPFQVLKEPGKTAESQSYLWALRGGPLEHPLLYYEYDPSRSGEVPKRLLRGFEGFLQTDGYTGYTAIGDEPGVVHVGCWAHARRKFDEALRGQKSKKGKAKPTAKQSKARQALTQIQELYKIERTLREAATEVRQRERLARSKPVIGKLRRWLDDALGTVPPQSLTGKALAYLDAQWPRLVRVLDDGRIPLDTNLVENAIRPFVLGRKNWLFADTQAGARASANLYSLIETAKANHIEPWRYLNHLFDVLPRVERAEELRRLLPWNLDPDALRPR